MRDTHDMSVKPRVRANDTFRSYKWPLFNHPDVTSVYMHTHTDRSDISSLVYG